MKDKLKKYLLPNLPYLFFVYLFDKLCQPQGFFSIIHLDMITLSPSQAANAHFLPPS